MKILYILLSDTKISEFIISKNVKNIGKILGIPVFTH